MPNTSIYKGAKPTSPKKQTHTDALYLLKRGIRGHNVLHIGRAQLRAQVRIRHRIAPLRIVLVLERLVEALMATAANEQKGNKDAVDRERRGDGRSVMREMTVANRVQIDQ
jgi:hypothetical protein